MIYNPLFTYPTYQPPHLPPQQQGGVVWVQGIEAAKAHPVGAGNSAILMDSEESVFYLKTTDASGMPQPIRIFDYVERVEQKTDMSIFVTRQELEDAIAKIKEEKNESIVRTDEPEQHNIAVREV